MKKLIVNCVNKMVKQTLKMNINSTTSFTAYQPKPPKKLKHFLNSNNDQ